MTRRVPVTLLVLGAMLTFAVHADAEPARNVEGYGISAELPEGWEGRMLRGTLMATTARLPPARGWLSTQLSRALRPGDVGLLLHEYAPIAGQPFDRGGYRRGAPRPFIAREFAGSTRQRLVRRNFAVAGRLFDLFVEVRERVPSDEAIARLNALVRSLEIEPGDHYAGTAPPARFRQAPGWRMRSRKASQLVPTTVSITAAATIRHRDRLNAFPPSRTLDALSPDGIVLRVTLIADNRHTPVAARGEALAPGPPYRLRHAHCSAFEGVPPEYRACVLRALVPRRYRVEIWVFYGRKRPTIEQRARAQAQLDRLVLPDWPRWS